MRQLGSTILVIATTLAACSGEGATSTVAANQPGGTGGVAPFGFGGAFGVPSTVAATGGAGGAAAPACEALHTPKGSMSAPCSCSTSQDDLVVQITRTVVSSYQKSGRLCAGDDATQVPLGRVPSGGAYQPNSSSGGDFASGTDAGGWRCIGFLTNLPLCAQLNYRRGSGYLSPKFGNLDPGPNAFEVSAIVDQNGDGNLGVVALVGHVDPARNEVVMDPIFRFQPFE